MHVNRVVSTPRASAGGAGRVARSCGARGLRPGGGGAPAQLPPMIGSQVAIWLRPVELERSRGYPDKQIGRILRITGEHEAEWLAEWEKRCGSD